MIIKIKNIIKNHQNSFFVRTIIIAILLNSLPFHISLSNDIKKKSKDNFTTSIIGYHNPFEIINIVSNPIFKKFNNTNELSSFTPYYLEILSAYKFDTKRNLYLVKNKTKQSGWISKDNVIDTFECMRSLNKNNPAYLKVLVINNWRLNEFSKAIPIMDGPGDVYTKKGDIEIFQIFYAFKSINNYVFIGTKPFWNEQNIDTNLIGWIKKDFCILWDNQIGVYFDKTTLENREPVLIFKEKENIVEYMKTGKKQNITAQELIEYIWDLPADVLRFPVIKDEGDYLKIAWIADLSRNKNREDNKELIKMLTIATQKVDLLFLIDATQSMGEHFKPVAEGISLFISRLEDKQKKNFRFGFGVYRDHDDGDKSFELICKFGDKNIEKKILQESLNTFSNDKDYPEAVFEGIYKGVTKINWGTSHIRAVVVIGDHGNHKAAKTKIDEDKIAEILKEKHVELYALNVPFQSTSSFFQPISDSFRFLFQFQLNTILKKLNSKRRVEVIQSQRLHKTNINKSENDQIRDITENFLNNIFSFSKNVSNGFRDISKKGLSFENIKDKHGVKVSDYMKSIMNEHLNKKNFKQKILSQSDYNQICSEGWVSKKSRKGVNQLKSYCLINRLKFDMLIGLLARLQNIFCLNEKNFADLIISSCELATGDPISGNEKIGDYLNRIFWIPFREKSKYLKFSPKEFNNKIIQDNKFRYEVIEDLNNALEKCRLIQENKNDDLWFTTSSGDKYCWIPFESLP